MSWQGIYGVENIAAQFARANFRQRLGGSFLFVGPQGVGKRLFAFALAKTLLCRRQFRKENDRWICDAASDPEAPQDELLRRFQPCGECDSCREFDLDVNAPEAVPPTHPDFHYVYKPADKSLLPLELLVGAKDERMQSGLCYELNRTSFLGGRRVAVIDDADYFNLEGANALLKTLEEPPMNAIIILVGTSAAKQLPTIRSRCQIFRFQPLADEDVAQILLARGDVGSPEEAERIARGAGGSVAEARRALDANFSKFQGTFLSELSRERLRAVELAAKVCEFVDKESKEARIRRPRLQEVVKTAIAYYRVLYRATREGDAFVAGEPGTSAVVPFARRALRTNPPSPECALDCEERSVDALEQIDRNANLPYVVEAWLYDLAARLRAR